MDSFPGWLIPLLISAGAIGLLIPQERRLHRRIQGVALLVTNNPQAAVLVYYICLLPGVMVHEVSQWLLARLLRVKVLKFSLWPEQQKKKGKPILLGLVNIDPATDDLRESLIGIIPLVSGLALLALIGNTRFNLDLLESMLLSGDLPLMARGIGQFLATPGILLWLYLMFAIANAMLPEHDDTINWWYLIGIAAGLVAILLVLDLGILLNAWLDGPFTLMLDWISAALVMVYLTNLLATGLLQLLETIMSRIFNRELEYD
ncbi:MAG: hypothetical protein IT326_08940 [Anaerolineae bacterium]|nr:hypothetical protein [Anaerolineae bacterium]